jgi:hypothetical protein
MGGYDNIEQALLNIRSAPSRPSSPSAPRASPRPRATTSMATCAWRAKHTRDPGRHRDRLRQHARLRGCLPGRLGQGHQGTWSRCFVTPAETRVAGRINVLPGAHLTPADMEEVRDIIESFGLDAAFVPDVSGSLDGHIPEDFTPTTLGGATLDDIRGLGCAASTWPSASRCALRPSSACRPLGVPCTLFDRLTGLTATDALVALLMRSVGQAGAGAPEASARPAPGRHARWSLPLRQARRHWCRTRPAVCPVFADRRDGRPKWPWPSPPPTRRCWSDCPWAKCWSATWKTWSTCAGGGLRSADHPFPRPPGRHAPGQAAVPHRHPDVRPHRHRPHLPASATGAPQPDLRGWQHLDGPHACPWPRRLAPARRGRGRCPGQPAAGCACASSSCSVSDEVVMTRSFPPEEHPS